RRRPSRETRPGRSPSRRRKLLRHPLPRHLRTPLPGIASVSHRKLRLIVLGMMGRCPYGGQTWLYLNWLRGLAANGHDVWYVEDDTVWPYDPSQNTVTDDCNYAVRHISTCLDRVGLAGKWAYRLADRDGACWG